jgi:plastocyanin
LTLLFLSACDDHKTPAPVSTATGATSREGNGIITGRVLLGGDLPSPKTIPGSNQIPDESIVASSARGLKNVIVYIENAPPATFQTQTPAVLDQISCQYVPHVLAIQTGQTLSLKSSDKLMHNVHLQCKFNPDANYGFQTTGQQDIHLKLAESPFKVTCDVHPWMSAWIGVFDHPWFAVTSDDGSFMISHVPPGQYKLIAWQEVLPPQDKIIQVNDSSTAPVSFVFPSP